MTPQKSKSVSGLTQNQLASYVYKFLLSHLFIKLPFKHILKIIIVLGSKKNMSVIYLSVLSFLA